jgi:CheY-like chemotaxis protein
VCAEAVNGIDATEKARTLNPDLILFDYSMPAMNGTETGAVLKAMLPGVPVPSYRGDRSCFDFRRHTGRGTEN